MGTNKTRSALAEATSQLNRAHARVVRAQAALFHAQAERQDARVVYEQVLGIGQPEEDEES